MMNEMMKQINNNSNDNNLSLILPFDNRNQDRPMTRNTFILARTDMEKLHFRAIQQALNKMNIRIRAVNQSNVLYICHDNDWRQKVNNYVEKINVYSLIGEINSSDDNNNNNNNNSDHHHHHCETILKTMSDQVVSTLHNLFIRKAITTEQYEQMMYFNQLSIFRINKLYFVPKLYKMNVRMHPMLTCFVDEPFNAIGRFLNSLLEPFYEQTMCSSICQSGIDAIRAFEKYADEGHLQSTTLLVHIQIHDLCTIFTHDFMIEALKKFFHAYTDNQSIHGTSITTILQLVQLVLENQYFLHENKLYQQLAGGPLGLSLTKTLANIYLWYWQTDVVLMLTNKKQLFGRCLDEIFFTWNESKDELQKVLNEMINNDYLKNTHVKITTSTGQKIHYLDAQFGHSNGILQTNVYHEQSIEPYALPYVYDTTTTRQDHSFLLRAALIRAVLFCSNVDEFENERFYIELSFLINNASLNFIEETIEKFFREFSIYAVDQNIDQESYDRLRQYIQRYHKQKTKYHLRQRKKRQQRRQKNDSYQTTREK